MVHHVTVVNSHMVSERYTCAENLSDKGTCGLQTVPHISAVKMCLWGAAVCISITAVYSSVG